ncbi:MAG: superoxide dismutase [Chloroflexota bacterium]|jgi:Fe-Mn family superoxide dismutase|nr:superoxide dismutase [Chloroflexota bacterium]
MAHTLPALTYATDALEPHFDKMTMEIHHGKHHQTYVTNLNNALAAYPDLQNKTAEELIKDLNAVPEAIRTAVRNNAGGHVNHSMFWQQIAPSKNRLSGALKADIEATWGSVDAFKDAFEKGGLGRFGSGWVWLVKKDGKLAITSTANQDNPIMEGATPIVGCDVWEHAYYLKYQNKRADYLKAFWSVIDWNDAEARYAAA